MTGSIVIIVMFLRSEVTRWFYADPKEWVKVKLPKLSFKLTFCAKWAVKWDGEMLRQRLSEIERI